MLNLRKHIVLLEDKSEDGSETHALSEFFKKMGAFEVMRCVTMPVEKHTRMLCLSYGISRDWYIVHLIPKTAIKGLIEATKPVFETES